MTASVAIQVELSGIYLRGTSDTRSQECPMGYPGDPEEIVGFRVTLNGMDITNGLDKNERLYLELVFLEQNRPD